MELAQDWGRVATAARRLLTLIDAPPDLPQPARPGHRAPMQGGVALERVSFSYTPGQPVLQEVSLHAEAGEMIGLVGHTGAGKSTVINLLARLYDADEGVVRLGGADVRSLAAADLGSQIGVVLQDTYLFLGSVAANIGYARPDAGRDRIVAAAMAADAHDFTVQLPDGYDTELGPGGHGLSRGQRQRLAIARALLMDPPGPADGRSHLQRRHRDRAAHPGRHLTGGARPHGGGDCPSAVHPAHGRAALRARRRTARVTNRWTLRGVCVLMRPQMLSHVERTTRCVTAFRLSARPIRAIAGGTRSPRRRPRRV